LIQLPSRRPLGLFDSGVGGLTVAQEIFTQLPDESIVYYGDTLYVPYGSRTREELITFADAISAFLIHQGAKVIIDACNSTSSVAIDYLRAKYAVPFVGVVEPGIRAALGSTRNGCLGVIGTEATIASEAHRQWALRLQPQVRVVTNACPRLVPLVEEGAVSSPEAYEALREYLLPLQDQGIDTLVLGCTHYPFFSPLIRQILGPEVTLVDPAQEAVRETASILAAASLRAPQGNTVQHRYYVSGDPESFRLNATGLTGRPFPMVQRVELERPGYQENREKVVL
jgi:glutamate racemase